jgi:GNAT superfamily N-acetyltransferase
VRIEQFDPSSDPGSLQACFEMTGDGWPIDHPHTPPWSLRSFTGKWISGFGVSPQRCWLATDDSGRAVGGYLLKLPDKENADRASCELVVAPARRRSGIGTALLRHCADQARQADRWWLRSHADDGSPGESFAAAMGARAGITDVQRVLTIGPGLPDLLTALRAGAEPHAAGYSLLSWSGVAPDEQLDDVARLNNAMADAPRDDGVQPTVWDADRVRRVEQEIAQHGVITHTVAARDRTTGEVAALTEICTEPAVPGWAFQMDTVVLPAHRGHRLGLLVKVAMLESLADLGVAVERIVTGNAGSNEHMIAINEQLGFEVASTHRHWELDLTKPLAGV